MERKVGEIFTCDGKTYLIVPREKEDYCIGCAFDLGEYACKKPRNDSRNNFGHCYFRFRKDKKGIIFKEINNMENNQLTIDIPEGMEIDLKNSDLAKGIVKFKKKDITYEDALKLCIHHKDIIVNESSASKLINLNKLMNIAKYYNGDWKPDWNTSNWNTYRESKYYIYYENSENKYGVGYTTDINWGNVYFKSRDDAQSVIDNPNFRDIIDAIYKD